VLELARATGALRKDHVMKPEVESLEPRRLMSDAWQTADDFQYTHPDFGTRSSSANAITVDSAGQIYAAGAVGFGALSSPDRQVHQLVRKSADGGATWSLLSDYVMPGAKVGTVSDIEVDAAGNIFLAGSDGSGYSYLRRSSDSGQTWATLDPLPQAYVADLTIDAAGNMYAVGNNNNRWLVRRSTDGGSTWLTVDTFSSSPYAFAHAVFAHPSGGIFVAGTAQVQSKRTVLEPWVVRRSLDGGSTWTTVDSYQLDTRYRAEARGLGADAAGNLYVVGDAAEKKGAFATSHWIVRKSMNGGNTWTTVDDFRHGYAAYANSFIKDAAGNLFVAGHGGKGDGVAYWTVRHNPGGTGAWSTVDEFVLSPGSWAVPSGIAADQAGRVFVAGYADDSSGTSHWLVRRTPAATAPATFSTTSIRADDAASSDDPTLAEELLRAAV
jgi:hypothetical protein